MTLIGRRRTTGVPMTNKVFARKSIVVTFNTKRYSFLFLPCVLSCFWLFLSCNISLFLFFWKVYERVGEEKRVEVDSLRTLSEKKIARMMQESQEAKWRDRLRLGDPHVEKKSQSYNTEVCIFSVE